MCENWDIISVYILLVGKDVISVNLFFISVFIMIKISKLL